MSIAVYKTDVSRKETSGSTVSAIQDQIGKYDGSFDLEDGDKVLRVENLNGPVYESAIEVLFEQIGHRIEQLPSKTIECL